MRSLVTLVTLPLTLRIRAERVILSDAACQLADALRKGKHIIPLVMESTWSHGVFANDWWLDLKIDWMRLGGDPRVPWGRCAEVEPIIVREEDLTPNMSAIPSHPMPLPTTPLISDCRARESCFPRWGSKCFAAAWGLS